MIKRINVGKFTHVGLSKKGKIHFGYWKNKDILKFVSYDDIMNYSKLSNKIKAKLRLSI